MEVVYILGNGFDLQIGLPTKYSDFYKYYTGLESKLESVKKLKEAINDKPKDWSDLEIALAHYTSQTNSEQEFCEAYDDLQHHLMYYIFTVDEMMKTGELEINTNSGSLEKGFLYPESTFGSDVAYTIEGEFNRIAPGLFQGRVAYNSYVITFNYTHIIEHYLKNVLGVHDASLPRYLNYVLHVHREVVNNQSIWIGVDNEEQIAKEEYRPAPSIQYRLLKPKIITELSRRMVDDAKRLIQAANVIVIFGASLGLSDMTWCKLLAEQIKLGVVVLLFVYNGKSYPSDNAKLIDQIKYRKDFVERMSGFGVDINDDSRIFVDINSSIFTNNTPNSHDVNLKVVLEKLREQSAMEQI